MSERYRTGEPARPPGDAEPLAYSYLAHRKVIGYLGIALPPVLVLVTRLRSTSEIQTSISAYYYTGAGAVFVGVLFAIGIFLFSYRGYEGHHADWWAGKAAFGFAIGVALFPTGPPEGVAAPPWWSPPWLHYVSAFLLFAAFIYFSGWLFTRGTTDPKGPSSEKKSRNKVYKRCAWVMISCIVGIATYGLADGMGAVPAGLAWFRPVFLLETILLGAFSVSWLVKGRAEKEWVTWIDWTRSRGRRLWGSMRVGGTGPP